MVPDIVAPLPIFWVAQAFAALAFAVMFWSNYSINRTTTVAGRGLSALLFTVEYALLGMWIPAAIAAVNTVRSFALVGAGTIRARQVLLVVFVTVHCALFVFVTGSFGSWVAMLPLVGAILSTLAMSMTRVSNIKALTVAASAVWITFFIVHGLWVNVFGDSLGVMFAAIAWWRARREEARTVTARASPSAVSLFSERLGWK